MRVSKKEIRDHEVIAALLDSAHVGRLGTIGGDGYPMVKPLNFVYREGVVYFHSAREGEKIEDIKREPRVCFEVDLPVAYARNMKEPCGTDYLYRSVIIRGRAVLVESAYEKTAALRMLLGKYEPSRKVESFPEQKLAITAIVRIDIETITGKEDLGKDGIRQQAVRAMTEGSTLPLLLDK